MNNNGKWVLAKDTNAESDSVDLAKYDVVTFKKGQFEKVVYIPKDADLTLEDLSSIEVRVAQTQWQTEYRGHKLILVWKQEN